jgi:hypothetical protein
VGAAVPLTVTVGVGSEEPLAGATICGVARLESIVVDPPADGVCPGARPTDAIDVPTVATSASRTDPGRLPSSMRM